MGRLSKILKKILLQVRKRINKEIILKNLKIFLTYYESHIVSSSLLTTAFVLILFSIVWLTSLNALTRGYQIKITEEDIANALHLASQEKIEEAKIAKQKREEAARLEQEIQERTARVERYFQIYGSPMQGYGEIIVRKAAECGGDYKILVGIAGNESGLGKIPYKTYNPYGYLDGVQYSGWSQSLNKLSCVISQRFIAPCKGDLYCIIRRYGGTDTRKDEWVRNVSFFMAQV